MMAMTYDYQKYSCLRLLLLRDLDGNGSIDSGRKLFNAAVNLAEFIHFAGDSRNGTGWDGAAQLVDLRDTVAVVHVNTNSCSRLLKKHRRPYPLKAIQRRYLKAIVTAAYLIASSPCKSIAGGQFDIKRSGRSTRPADQIQEANP